MLNYNYIVVLMLWLSVVKADYHHRSNIINGLPPKDTSFQSGSFRQDMNLSDYIWNGAMDLLPKAWATTFIAGVANGDMNPNFYGIYILQDAVYCRKVAQLWMQLANNVSVNDEIREYASNSISGFQKCSTELFDGWNVKDDRENDYGVVVRKPTMDYVKFMEDAMVEYPPNMLIATYACLKLWNNLIGDLLQIVENSTTNPYRVWVYENHGSGSSMRRQAAQMNEWDKKYQWYNWVEALCLFRIAIKSEINFFEHGGNSSASSTIHTTQCSNQFLSKEKAI